MSYKNLSKLPIVLILLLVFLGCEKKEEKKVETKEIKKIEVEVNKITKNTYPIWVNFSGKTEAFKNVEVTSRVSGELKEIYFKAGDEVKKDQLLFKIDDSQYKAILEQKIAGLQKDEASLNLAISNVNRYKPLVKDGLAPREKLDELVATQKQLQAVVNASKASIKQATLDVEYTQIKETIDGKVVKNLLYVVNILNAT